MQIKLRNKVNPNLSPTEQILVNRGMELEDVPRYLNLTSDELNDFELLDNIEEAVDITYKHIKKNSKIMIQVDSDVDGYTSAALLYNFLEKNFPGIELYFQVHDEKTHGLEMTEKVLNGEYPLIFVPDAGSNEFEKHKELKEKGIDVIVLDHHEAPKYSDDAIIVNNQLSKNYPNKELSGVGVVMQFCRAMQYLGEEFLEYGWIDFVDLVAIGNVADMMDLKSFETKFLVEQGLKQINQKKGTVNKFVQAIVERQSYSLGEEVTPIGIAFYIAPLINATVRVGTPDERKMAFECFIDSIALDEVPSTKRGAKAGEMEIRVEQGVRVMGNIRNRQKREEEKGTEAFGGHINQEYLDNNSLIVLDTEGAVVKDLNGLIANQMQSRYKRPALVVREVDGYIEGSGRGHETNIMDDFRQFIRDSGLAVFAEGHANAFGVKFEKDKFEEFIEYANENLDYGNAHKEYLVDYDVDVEDLDYSLIMEIAKLKSLWGVGVEEPYIAIRNVNIDDLQVMKSNTIKFFLGNSKVPCLKFRATEELIEELSPEQYRTKVVDIVGRPNLNYFNSEYTPQIFMTDYKVVDTVMLF